VSPHFIWYTYAPVQPLTPNPKMTQIFQTLSKAFIFDELTTEVYDRVLVQRELQSLVEQGRQVTTQGATKKFGKIIMNPLARFSPKA
jgi:hypothetical protein